MLVRTMQGFAVWFAAVTVAFFLLHSFPGDSARLILGGTSASVNPTPSELAVVNARFGLNRSVFMQYLSFLGRLLTGDLGVSYQTGIPVTHTFASSVPQTLELACVALLCATLLGVTLGSLVVLAPWRWLRSSLEAAPAFAVSMPTFWVGIMLIELVSFQLGLLPAFGSRGLASLILPGFSMAVPAAGMLAQVLSHSLASTLAEPYVEAVQAKGASTGRTFCHAFRAALLPVVTMLGLLAAEMVALSTVTETVFSRYGLGSVLTQAVKVRDIPVVMAGTSLIVAVYVVATLIIDFCYPFIDPRIRMTTVRQRPAGGTA